MAKTHHTLVLMLYPISADFKQEILNTTGEDCQFQSVSSLRSKGSMRLLLHLLKTKIRTVIIPIEVQEARAVLPIISLLAFAHRFPRVFVCQPDGQLNRVTFLEIARSAIQLPIAIAQGWVARLLAMKCAKAQIKSQYHTHAPHTPSHNVLYIKNNIWYGLRAGGSVGHVSGVINAFVDMGHTVRYLSPEAPRHLCSAVKHVAVPPHRQFSIPAEANFLRTHHAAVKVGTKTSSIDAPTLIYQRLSLGDFSGAELARKLRVPFVVEYNGSEVWVSKNWGNNLRYTSAHEAAEDAMLSAADLVFAVSEPLRDEVVSRGVDPTRVAWYPNCVDADIYDSARLSESDRLRIRTSWGDDQDYVFMFVGTFGKWHGAEVLAEAAALITQDESWCTIHRPRFVFIGDGETMPLCQEIIHQSTAKKYTVFTGLIEQDQTPQLMAAADAFVAPHVPNADGTKFFGSPTKLFEYMAMGKPIVASKLDQIGDILDHGHTAHMVSPGSPEHLATGLRDLVLSQDKANAMGMRARQLVLQKYTWRVHVEKILDALHLAGKS